MKIKYIGQTSPLELTHDKIYDVISIEKGWYRIVDDLGAEPEKELPGFLYRRICLRSWRDKLPKRKRRVKRNGEICIKETECSVRFLSMQLSF